MFWPSVRQFRTNITTTTAERAECPKCGQYRSRSNMSKHLKICEADFFVGKVFVNVQSV